MLSRRITTLAAFGLGILGGLGAAGLGMLQPIEGLVETKPAFEEEVTVEEVGEGRIVISSQHHHLLFVRNPPNPDVGIPDLREPIGSLGPIEVIPLGDKDPIVWGQGGTVFKMQPVLKCINPPSCIPCKDPIAQCGIVEFPRSLTPRLLPTCDCNLICDKQPQGPCKLPKGGCDCSK